MKLALRSPRRILWVSVLAAILAINVLFAVSNLIQDGLWMNQMGYATVFWRIFSFKFAAAALALLVVFAYLWLNLRFAGAAIFRLRGTTIDRRRAAYTKQGLAVPAGWFHLGTPAHRRAGRSDVCFDVLCAMG